MSERWRHGGFFGKMPALVNRVRDWLADARDDAIEFKEEQLDKLQRDLDKALMSHDNKRVNGLLDSVLGSALMTNPLVHSAALQMASRQLTEAIESDDPTRLKGALVAAKRLSATDLPEFEAAVQRYQEVNQLPSNWDVSRIVRERRGSKLVLKMSVSDNFLRQAFQGLLDASHRCVYTRDRKNTQVPTRLVLVRAVEVANQDLWTDYMKRQQEIRLALGLEGAERVIPATQVGDANVGHTTDNVDHDARCAAVRNYMTPKLDENVNEVLLFHGTSPIASEQITRGNFRVNLAGSTTGTLYGRGIYLAENASKSDEYAPEDPEHGFHTLLVCRITLGRAWYTSERHPDPRECEDACHSSCFHSVLGDRRRCRGTYREFVIFDEEQVYPNFILTYKRSYAVMMETE